MFLGNQISGLKYDEHGGGCCGIIHLHTFPPIKASHAEKVGWIRKAISNAILSEYDNGDLEVEVDDWRCGIEVVLTDGQLDGWRAALEAVGFSRVFSFLNSNSGNVCNVFYLEHGVQ